MKISDHITFAEAIHSNTAKRYGIENIPNEEQTNNMKVLAEKIFEPLRLWVGGPIKITSMFRSEELNKVTLHTCFGADNFTNHNYSNFQDVYPALLKSKIKNFHLPFASLGEGNFEEVLKCIKDNLNGKFVYLGFVSHLAKDVETPKRVAERIELARPHGPDDRWVVPHNLELAAFSPATVNVMLFDPEWGAEESRQYAGKYCGKPEPWVLGALSPKRKGKSGHDPCFRVEIKQDCVEHNRLQPPKCTSEPTVFWCQSRLLAKPPNWNCGEAQGDGL